MNKGRSCVPSPPAPIGCLLPFYTFTKIKVIHMKKTCSILNQGDPGYISDNIHISSVCLAFPRCQRHNHLTSGEHPTKAIRCLKQKQEQAELVLEYSDISTSSLSESILYFLQTLMLKMDPGSSSPHQWAYSPSC